MMVRGREAGERGAAAVEFAIVLPLLFLVIFGLVDFSIAMYDKTLITSASREGARFGAIYSRDADRPSCDDIYPAAIQPFEQGIIAFTAGGKTIARNCFLCTSAGVCTPVAAAAHVCSAAAAQARSRIAVETVLTHTYLAIPKFMKSSSGNPLMSGTVIMRSTTLMNCE